MERLRPKRVWPEELRSAPVIWLPGDRLTLTDTPRTLTVIRPVQRAHHGRNAARQSQAASNGSMSSLFLLKSVSVPAAISDTPYQQPCN